MIPHSVKNILLLEDERVTRTALCNAFDKHNYNYVATENLQQAMEKLQSQQFDLIFSDIKLPDGTGLDLLKRVKTYQLDVPFIVITSSEDERLLQNAMDLGASDFLSKPFNLDNLTTIVNRNVARKRLEQKRRNPRNEKALLMAIKALISALEAKDSYTSGHSLRVAHYARLMGEVMHLNEDELYCLNLSALLHDIGKIGLPDHILKKSSFLLESEYNRAKEHPMIGSRIVGNIEELHEVASIIRHHHERFDGLGYPDRLKGEAIPLLARILAIVDAYEAIVSHRHYGEELSPKEAMKELQKNAGTQFDPNLVNIFLSLESHPDFHNISTEVF